MPYVRNHADFDVFCHPAGVLVPAGGRVEVTGDVAALVSFAGVFTVEPDHAAAVEAPAASAASEAPAADGAAAVLAEIASEAAAEPAAIPAA